MSGVCDVRGDERQDLCSSTRPLSGGHGDNLDRTRLERDNGKVHLGAEVHFPDTTLRPVGGDHGASGLDRGK
eukprot:7359354-Heterocapsa_arctica.AAC.1